jgi:hypothetical protein
VWLNAPEPWGDEERRDDAPGDQEPKELKGKDDERANV